MEGYAFISECHESRSYRDAIESSDADVWKAAMDDEVKALKKNKTWDLVNLPDNRKAIDNKWVFKAKFSKSNEVYRYKARLVVREFTKREGIDYAETFSPVARFTSIRANDSRRRRSYLKQFDIKTAFLNGDREESIYMSQAEGYDDNSGRVCKLNKSLYGLKQSFTKLLKQFSFSSSSADPCVFVSQNRQQRIMMALYIDDALIRASDEDDVVQLISYLQQHFEVKVSDIGLYLGLQIEQLEQGGIHLSQSYYSERVLKKFNTYDCHPVSTPAEVSPGCKPTDESISKATNFPYREAVGSLMYLTVAARPDISYAVGVVSSYLDKPTTAHVNAVKRIFKYVKGTINYGILLTNKSKFSVTSYSDADNAGDVETRRSTSVNEVPISWASQRQKCVSLSTTEAEYVAASEAVKEMTGAKGLLRNLLPENCLNPVQFMDNQSAIRLVKNSEFHRRTKHVDIKYHFIREKFNPGDFDLNYVPTDKQLADVSTKPLPRGKLELFRKILNIVPNS